MSPEPTSLRLGEIEVQQGTLTILGNTTLGDTTKNLTVQPNAVLAFWQNAPTGEEWDGLYIVSPSAPTPNRHGRCSTVGHAD